MAEGSDIYEEMFCEVCKKKRRNAKASGFCTVCTKYMCTVCLDYHREFNPDHTQQDANDMPKDFCMQMCSKHVDEIIKFYCTKCKTFSCDICTKEHSKTCRKSVEHLPQYVGNIENSEELKAFDKKCNQIANTIDSIQTKAEDQNNTVENCAAKFIAQIDNLQDDMNRKFNKVKEDMAASLETLQKLDKERIAVLMEQTNTLKTQLENIRSAKERMLACNQKCDMFIATTRAENELVSIAKATAKAEEVSCTTVNKFHFHQSNHLKAILEDHQSLGEIILDSETKHKVIEEKPLKLKYESTAFFGRTFDALRPMGMCLVLQKFLVIIGDFEFGLLKVIDIENDTLKASLTLKTLKSMPKGITSLGENQVAVTTPDNRLIQIFTIASDGGIILNRVEKVGLGVRGIVHDGQNFIVSYDRPESCINMINDKGRVIRTVYANRNRLLVSPCALGLNPDGNVLYVTDQEQNLVISMTLFGRIIHKRSFFQDDLKPCSLSVDQNGSVYVCGINRQSILQLSEKLETVAEFRRTRHIENLRCTVLFAGNKLYFTQQLLEEIKVYRLN